MKKVVVTSVAISADGEYIAAGSWDRKVYLFDKDSSTPLWSYDTEDYVYTVSISADGEYITAGSEDNKVYLFDKDSSTPLWSYETDDGVKAVKLLARVHKDAAKANEVLKKIENGEMTHVSIDWLSKDLDVMGEPFATDIRPIEVSFIDNETRTPVCDACTIETKCEKNEDESCSCGGDEKQTCT